jgi:hypothetical protein
MKRMIKKFYFTLKAALVLANASLASNQLAGASPNADQGPGTDAHCSTL